MTDITLNSTLVRRLNHGKMSRALCLEAADRIEALQAWLDARCDHSELYKEIERLSDENKRLVKADKHREKVWKERIKELKERIELALRLEQTDIVGFISEALRGRKFSELPKDVQDCLLECEALEKPE